MESLLSITEDPRMAGLDLDEGVGLGWGMYAAKLAGALLWLVASVVAALVISEPTLSPGARAAAGLAVAIPAMAWLRLSVRRIRRADEFDRNLIRIALTSGTAWALVFGSMLVGLAGIRQAITGSNQDIARLGLALVCMQPATAILFGESMAQIARWKYGRRDPV
jgi:hypothetical protein